MKYILFFLLLYTFGCKSQPKKLNAPFDYQLSRWDKWDTIGRRATMVVYKNAYDEKDTVYEDGIGNAITPEMFFIWNNNEYSNPFHSKYWPIGISINGKDTAYSLNGCLISKDHFDEIMYHYH